MNCAGDGLDPDPCAFDLWRLLGRHGDGLPFPWRAKHLLPAKAFGCFPPPQPCPPSPYLRGFSDDFVMPVSRWTEMRQADIDQRRA